MAQNSPVAPDNGLQGSTNLPAPPPPRPTISLCPHFLLLSPSLSSSHRDLLVLSQVLQASPCLGCLHVLSLYLMALLPQGSTRLTPSPPSGLQRSASQRSLLLPPYLKLQRATPVSLNSPFSFSALFLAISLSIIR